MVKLRSSLTEKLAPASFLVIVVLVFFVGVLWQKVNQLEKGGVATGAVATTADTQQQAVAPTVTLDQVKDVFSKNVIKFGDASKKLLLVEIADPSCPYCHAAAGKNPELSSQIGPNFKLVADGGTYVAPVIEFEKLVNEGKASFAYVYFPGHGNGEMGTKAMFCAHEVGKFWPVHNLLMTNAGYNLINNDVKNDKTKSGQLADFLKSVTDSGKLKNCLDSGKYDQALTDNTAIARGLNVQGTPGFFVNASAFAGAYSYTDMKSSVDSALK